MSHQRVDMREEQLNTACGKPVVWYWTYNLLGTYGQINYFILTKKSFLCPGCIEAAKLENFAKF